MFDSAGTLGLECKLYSFSCRIQSVDFEFACRGQVSYLRCNGFKCHIVIFNDPVNLLVFYRDNDHSLGFIPRWRWADSSLLWSWKCCFRVGRVLKMLKLLKACKPVPWRFTLLPFVTVHLPFLLNSLALFYNFGKSWKSDPGIIKASEEQKKKVNMCPSALTVWMDSQTPRLNLCSVSSL